MNEITFKWSDAVDGGMVPINIDIIMANLMAARYAHARTPFPILLAAGSNKEPMRPAKKGWTLDHNEYLPEVGLMNLVKKMALDPTDVDTLTITLSSSTDDQKALPTKASEEEIAAMREIAAPRVFGTWLNLTSFHPTGYMYGPHIFEGAPMYDGVLDQPLPLCARPLTHKTCENFARLQVVLASARFSTSMVKVEPVDLPVGLPTTGYIRNAAEIRAIGLLLRSLARLLAWQWPLTTLLASQALADLAKEDAGRRGFDDVVRRIDNCYQRARAVPLCPDSKGLLAALTGAKITTLEGDGPLIPYTYRNFGERIAEHQGRTFRMLDFLPWIKGLATARHEDVAGVPVKDGPPMDGNSLNIFSISEALERMPEQELQRMIRMAAHLGWSGATDMGKYDLTFDRASYVVTDGDHASEASASLLLGTKYVLPLTSRHRTILPTHKLMDWGYTVLPVPMDEDPWEPWHTGFTDKVMPKWASMGEAGAEELDPVSIEEVLAVTGVRPLSDVYVPNWPNTPGYSEFVGHDEPLPPVDPTETPGNKMSVGQELNGGDPIDQFLFMQARATPVEAVALLGRGDPRGRLLYRRGSEVFSTRIVVRRSYTPIYVPMQKGGTWIGDERSAFTRWEAGMDMSMPTGDLGSALFRTVHITQGGTT